MLQECGPRQTLGRSAGWVQRYRNDRKVTEENVTKAVLICTQEMAIRAQTLEPEDNIEHDRP